jgi:predicted DNA-binding protein (UPF0251 family)
MRRIMTLQIINDKDITGIDGKVSYVNGVELVFEHIPDGQHEDRIEALTVQINSVREIEQNLSQQRARLLEHIVDNNKLSVIKCAEIMKVSRQRVYKIIESVKNKLEEE